MSSLLTEIVLPHRPLHLPCPTTVTDGDRRSLFVALEAIEGPRDPRGRYPLVAIVATTVWRLLIRVDAAVLSQVLARWLRSRATPVPDPGHWWRRVIAVDGKVERGARPPDGRQVHLLSAYDTSTAHRARSGPDRGEVE